MTVQWNGRAMGSQAPSLQTLWEPRGCLWRRAAETGAAPGVTDWGCIDVYQSSPSRLRSGAAPERPRSAASQLVPESPEFPERCGRGAGAARSHPARGRPEGGAGESPPSAAGLRGSGTGTGTGAGTGAGTERERERERERNGSGNGSGNANGSGNGTGTGTERERERERNGSGNGNGSGSRVWPGGPAVGGQRLRRGWSFTPPGLSEEGLSTILSAGASHCKPEVLTAGRAAEHIYPEMCCTKSPVASFCIPACSSQGERLHEGHQ
ncbi:cell wall protein IFF6-like [Corvus hawaiiensis]|uniref:cell wall protein IFF6-like n=1 Tax=Corvus hawaiiensis TaxID=134902 RepID=UPI0020198265|nr:cell wall protein IFF6-like [Corvus hawaiiensis]